MIGRVRYYRERAKLRWQQAGLYGLIGELFSFLIRRRFLFGFLFESIEYHVLSHGRKLGSTVLQELKELPMNGSKVLLYASFDSTSTIQAHVVQQLQFFCSSGYQIIWVSTSALVSETEFEKIAGFVRVAIHRKNDGYDFASWKLAYTYLNDFKPTSLIMMNDSCLGPEFNFTPYLQRMESQEDSAYGITKSYEIAEYLQSYFIHFGRGVLNKGAVNQYFERIRILRSKWAIVRYLEIGGSQFLLRAGVKLKALIDPKEPQIAAVMEKFELTDPVRDPAAKEWVRLGLNPFWKRSNIIKA